MVRASSALCNSAGTLINAREAYQHASAGQAALLVENPVGDNASAEGRANIRREEIVVTPAAKL